MALNQAFMMELEHEAGSTKKLLDRIPEEKFDWKPHDKSMSMIQLAAHIAEMPAWLMMTVTTDELDFATTPYQRPNFTTKQELLEFFDKNVKEAQETLKNTDDTKMMETWTMRNGEQIFMQLPRITVLRSSVFNHLYHHRGQLSVYLRMNEAPVPGMYGPSADEQM